MRRPLAERFWEKVEKRGPDECWPWRGATMPSGRGVTMDEQSRRLYAPRAAVILSGREMPAEKYACHHCDNPNCVNPAHIYVGDAYTNAVDSAARGRWINPMSIKTHCKNGHPFSGDNLIERDAAKKHRRCRACQQASKRRYYYGNLDKVRAAAREYQRAKKQGVAS
jgi:hypothetical protein